jgi:hypothetical protein
MRLSQAIGVSLFLAVAFLYSSSAESQPPKLESKAPNDTSTTRSETDEWEWLSPNWVPCKGIGIHGTYRVYAQAHVNFLSTGGKRINEIIVYASSSVVSESNSELSVSARVEDNNGKSSQAVTLVRLPANSLGIKPKQNETSRKYLPNGSSLDLPDGSNLRLDVSLLLKTPASGNCSLGSSSYATNLSQRILQSAPVPVKFKVIKP